MSKDADKQERTEDFSLEALREGDRVEFSRLVEAYSPNIYRLALKIIGNKQDAEDILQETFFKAYKYLKNFDGRSKVSTWLYRIATNEALMLIRRRKLDTISIDEPWESADEDQEPLQIVDWRCLPESELMSSEVREQLDEAVDSLTHSLRVVFILRDIEKLTTAETAEVLGLTETAVKTRLSRARLRLRQELTKYLGERMERQLHGS
jgi:RNA polymerase sigma-70 factor (ECF subfamily)